MSKNLIKKSLLLSTVVLSMAAASQVKADETLAWTPRSVEEIRAGLVKDGNKIVYTVQYGDTLTSIAEAVGVDVNVLANLNKIADINFILPNTVLTITYDTNQDVKSVQVEAPVTSSNEQVTAKADLTTNEVVVNDQTIKVADLTVDPASQPVPVVVSDVSKPETSAAPEMSVSEATSEVASEMSLSSSEVTVNEEVSASSESVAEEVTSESTSEAPVESISSEVSTSTSEVTSETSSSSSETVASEEASSASSESVTEETTSEAPASDEPASESDQTTPSVEEVTQSIVEAGESTTNYGQTDQPVVEAVNQVVEASAEESEVSQETPASETVVAEQPAVAETPAPTEEVTQPATEVAPTSQMTYNSTGMQPKAAAFQSQVGNAFGISDVGGYRAGDQDHGKGLAVDVMVNSAAQGDQVAQYAVDNIANNDIAYVIWQQRFYAPVNNIYGPANTWNPMPDRGSATQNHMDHVHVSMNE